MEFEWDNDKNTTNLAKHGISFEEAAHIFDGAVVSRQDTRFDYGETRTISIGQIAGPDTAFVVVTVVHTDREGCIRLISARYASPRERKDYHDHDPQKA
jgi:uncharacterized protein